MKTLSRYMNIIPTVLLILLPSCSYIYEKLDFTQPEIISIYPSNLMTNVENDVVIEVRFSREMDTVKTNNSFSLSSASGMVSGYFRWSDSGRRLSFEPKKILNDSEMYTITITTSAEDKDGNDLKEATTSVFYVNTDLNSPEIQSHSPASNETGVLPDLSDLSPPGYITIIFSEAIDPDTLYDGITISPAVQGTYAWDVTQQIITFNPVYDLNYGTTYTVTISESLTDISGNPFLEQYSFNFTVGDDFEKPEVLSVYQDLPAPGNYNWTENGVNDEIEKDQDIIIAFSEEIAVDTLYDAITISPSCDFYIDTNATNDQAVIVFNSPAESETNYTLTISSTVTDLQGNNLIKEYVYQFYTDGVNSIRPEVVEINDPIEGVWPLGEIVSLNIFNPYVDIHAVFSAEMIPSSITIVAERVIGDAGNPVIINPDWPDTAPGRFRVYEFDLSGLLAGNIYKLTLKGGSDGARDIYGNCMKDDFVQYIRF
jgi:hypothetical protein